MGCGVTRGRLAVVRRPAVLVHRRKGSSSLARQLLLLQALVVGVAVPVSTRVAYVDARRAVEHSAAVRATAVEESVADSPTVVDAVSGPDPTAVLQPYVEQGRRDTGTSFITVFAPDRTRYTHPNPAEIGRPFRRTLAPPLGGRTFPDTYTGALSPSVRATGPILDRNGKVVALVSAGITLDAIGADLTRALPGIVGTGLVTLAAGTAGSWLISRRLRRQTDGLDAPTLARMLDYYNAVL